MTPPQQCRICGSTQRSHQESEHPFILTSKPGEPLTFTILVKGLRTTDIRAKVVGQASREITGCYPNKKFSQPIVSRYELQCDRGDKGTLNDAYVTEYFIYEL